MKKSAITALHRKLTMALLSFMVALLVIVSLPLNLMGGAAAEVVTAESKDSGNNVMTSAAGVSVDVTVNYYRKNGDYTGWNIWIWETATGGDGSKYAHDFETETVDFEGYEGKMWKTMTVTINNVDLSVANAIGIIIRQSTATNEWAQQTGDMMITADEIVDNKVSIYILEGIETLYYSVEDAMAIKFSRAYFSDFNTITFTTSQAIPENSVFVVRNLAGEEVATLPAVYEEGEGDDAVKYDISGKTKATIAIDDFDMTETYMLGDEPEDFDKETNFAPAIAVSKTELYETPEFAEKYEYDGELGVDYTAERSIFRVWTPTASSVELRIYANGETGDAEKVVQMTAGEKSVWTATVEADLKDKYYTYFVTNNGVGQEVVDPYARSGGRNGIRGMVVDLDSTNPEGWDTQSIPDYGTTTNAITTAVIYEAHLRDLTIDPSSGVSAANRGKFLGLTETGTVNSNGSSTALDYLKELGITQVHFQPLFDFASVNEDFNVATYNRAERNWGYDPLNYNMPEGSYSSDSANGNTRVNEMKQMIMALHNAGIQVIMDVVYNHVSSAPSSNFEYLVPGYYFRLTTQGKYFNGSGCGNETASDHYMFRRFMIDSVKYWTEEYKVDGFRFDLMALHDIETMNQLYTELAAINPDVLVYGEGWTGGTSGLASTKQSTMANCNKLNSNIAVFDDIVRDGIKGHYDQSYITQKGFATGAVGNEAAVYVGAAGGTNVLLPSKYTSLGKSSFAAQPTQNINYVSAHDNSTLWDKINASVVGDNETKKAMNRVAAASILTSQGASFMLAGEEMLRSKPVTKADAETYDSRAIAYIEDSSYLYSDNSYKSLDYTNAINWDLIDDNADMVEFYKGMIQVKKTFTQFQFTDRLTLRDNVFFVDDDFDDGIATYLIREPDTMDFMVVIMNVNDADMYVTVPNGNYDVIVNGDQVDVNGLSQFSGKRMAVGAYSTVILKGTLTGNNLYNYDNYTFADYKGVGAEPDNGGNLGLALGLGIGIPVAVLIAGGVVFGVMYSKKKKGNGDKAENEAEASDDNKPEEDKASEETKSEDGEQAPDAKVEDAPADPPAAD